MSTQRFSGWNWFKQKSRRRQKQYNGGNLFEFGGRRRRHHTRKNKWRVKKHCSPIVEGQTALPYTCYTKDILFKLRNRWNQRHSDAKITTNQPHEIWKQLKINMENVCDEEKCWINQNFVDKTTKKEIKEIAFVPEAPKEWKLNPNTWLNSLDITKVMKQYEKRYKCFRFIGPSPIDFDSRYMDTDQCVWEELCKFSLDKYIDKGVNKIGMIFNLDKHTQPGSHWVSLFIKWNKNAAKKHAAGGGDGGNRHDDNFIFYFNSTGASIPPELDKLCKRIMDQGKQHNIVFHFDQNKKEHQKENTECGMYSLFFIITMLKDQANINYFKHDNIPDKEMEKFRKVYFSGGKK